MDSQIKIAIHYTNRNNPENLFLSNGKIGRITPDFDYRYVDIHAEGITKEDLSKSVGKPVETVPQIFIDEKPIGGCTDFEALMKDKFGVVA